MIFQFVGIIVIGLLAVVSLSVLRDTTPAAIARRRERDVERCRNPDGMSMSVKNGRVRYHRY